MKRFIGVFCAVIMSVFAVFGLSACAATEKSNSDDSGQNKLKIVTTIFPEYDWTRRILGDRAKDVDLTLLLDKGEDLHSWQPAAEDIATISDCDLFIYVGSNSDSWVEGALKNATNKDIKSINLLDVLGSSVKNEEIVDGMQEEAEEGEEENEKDEHVWLSLKNAKKCSQAIFEMVSELDPDGEPEYEKNFAAYMDELSALDEEFTKEVEASDKKPLIFADRFPFRYLVDDYGLSYYAAFPGCSSESDASFETITFLANKMDEFGVTHLITIEGSNSKIADAVIQNTKSKTGDVLVMDSMQTVLPGETEGETYISIMTKNLEVLKQALK